MDDKALRVDSFKTNDAQESSNKEVRLDEHIGSLQFGFSSLGSVLSFVVYCSDRRRRILLSSCFAEE